MTALSNREIYAVQGEGYAALMDNQTPLANPYPWSDQERCKAWIAGYAMARTERAMAMAGPVTKSADTARLSTEHHPLGTHGLWHDRGAQLPAYIQNIAHALRRDGHSESEAIQLAIAAVRRLASGGDHVKPEVREAASRALAEWEKLKAEHHKTQKRFDPGELRDAHGRWTRGTALLERPKDTFEKHTDEAGNFTPARQKLHQQIVDDAIAGHNPMAHPKATFLGGGPASGKSVVLADGYKGVHIDADMVKKKIPEYNKMTAEGDDGAAAYAHEESSYVSKEIMKAAIKRHTDFMLDSTGDSSIEKLADKVRQAREAGFQTHAAYVTVNTDEAVRRSMQRAQETGRFVPEEFIRATHSSVSDTFSQAIQRDLFDTAELWDTNGGTPSLVGSKAEGGMWQVHDQAAWNAFLAKAQQ